MDAQDFIIVFSQLLCMFAALYKLTLPWLQKEKRKNKHTKINLDSPALEQGCCVWNGLYHLLRVWTWRSHSIFLSLNFFIYKIGQMISILYNEFEECLCKHDRKPVRWNLLNQKSADFLCTSPDSQYLRICWYMVSVTSTQICVL